LLEALLRRHQPLMVSPPPDVEALTRYLSGVLSADATGAVERGIIAHPSSRQQLRQVRAILRELQTLLWAEVSERTKADDLTGAVAQVWLTIAAERVAAAARAPAWWGQQVWSDVRQKVAAGVAEAQAAWAAFAAFGRQLQAALSLPRLAWARGQERPEGVVVVSSEGEVVVLVPVIAEVTSHGALRVVVNVRTPTGDPTNAVDGQTVHLALAWGDEVWHVASSAIEGDRVEWNLPELGAALGLPPGQLLADCLRLTLGKWESQQRAERVPVLAEIVDADGQPITAHYALIEFVGEPRWTNGQFELAVALSPETRTTYRHHLLMIDVIISTRRYQRIGAWRVSDWRDEVRTLTAPCPGSPEAMVPCASALRARLQAL
ncbi:MAG: hypothetical protein NZT92_18960, partial [Abditibacteriales bacterium]|nr:hypothetical protein [Abditibacteriales bacterium]